MVFGLLPKCAAAPSVRTPQHGGACPRGRAGDAYRPMHGIFAGRRVRAASKE
jgi:hypothetical protein